MLVDLSHDIFDGLETYPGLPAPIVGAHRSHTDPQPGYAPGTTFHIGRIEMVANTGTYLDAPFHRYPDGEDLAALPLESVAALPAVVVRSRARAPARALEPAELPPGDLRGHAVLFDTGWSRHWNTPRYSSGHPYLAGATARALVERGVALVGIDSLNIDDAADAERPVHSRLLKAGIPIVEHLTNLAALPERGFRFFAVPVKIRGMGTFPVRAFAEVERSAS